MQQDHESKLMVTFKYVASKTVDLYNYLFDISKPHIEQGLEKAEPIIIRSKQFYQQHKEIILIIGVASLTYLIVRPRNKQQQKGKKKKTASPKIVIPTKTFMSDNSLDELKEEPSTTVRVESSGREALKKKALPKRALERIQSSSSEEGGQKIFFQMYRNYQGA